MVMFYELKSYYLSVLFNKLYYIISILLNYLENVFIILAFLYVKLLRVRGRENFAALTSPLEKIKHVFYFILYNVKF